MKKFTYSISYGGEQLFLVCYAKSVKEAAKLFGVNNYIANHQLIGNKVANKEFEGVQAYFDSGKLWRKHPDLIEKLMPLEELKKLIDQLTLHDNERRSNQEIYYAS